ncbi:MULTISPECIES: TMEM175 family protein [unclassified Xanthobacter]|uniref:TMEM175 family protein n=1 Tax=unclassified Xanthobacter TaxID=2623496 RepID=UPI001EDF1E5A|nr:MULTISPECIES: TMEM175 family protein [unclassified Xanthobacter]
MRPFPKARVDALCDGIFAFAMTLLVVDIRLPEGLAVTTSAELAQQLTRLTPQAVAYVISFFVLAAEWRATIAIRHDTEAVSGRALQVWLWFLLFVTMVPFSSALVGRYGHLPLAVWVYAFNMAGLGLLSLPLHRMEVPAAVRTQGSAGQRRTFLFIGSAVASVLVSLWAPNYAMYAYLLNALGRVPPFR